MNKETYGALKRIIEEIKENMHEHRINAANLARALNIDPSTVSLHLSGKLRLSRAYYAAYKYYFLYRTTLR